MDWLIYFGAITGTIGAITGITGAIVAGRAHRFTKQVKAQDLRMQLRTALVEYRLIVEALPPLIEYVSQSRQRVMSAKGGGGNLHLWLEQQTKDLAAARTLEMGLPNSATTYYDLDPQALEDKIVALHRQRIEADRLKSKYEAELAADEKARAAIEDSAMSILLGGVGNRR
jgi:hypothetical protein